MWCVAGVCLWRWYSFVYRLVEVWSGEHAGEVSNVVERGLSRHRYRGPSDVDHSIQSTPLPRGERRHFAYIAH